MINFRCYCVLISAIFLNTFLQDDFFINVENIATEYLGLIISSYRVHHHDTAIIPAQRVEMQ